MVILLGQTFFGMGHRKEPGVVVLQLSSIASELTDDGKC